MSPYGKQTGRDGPWGRGKSTNRDHLLAFSELKHFRDQGQDFYNANTNSQLKANALSVVVSGRHHEKGSATFKSKATQRLPPIDKGTLLAADAAGEEIKAMLDWKANPSNSWNPTRLHSRLRIEMVGA